MTRQHLARSFRRKVGIAPKQLVRIARTWRGSPPSSATQCSRRGSCCHRRSRRRAHGRPEPH
jgi:AraC-like DNA-binding protein